MDNVLKMYIDNSYELLQSYNKKGRYFHTLTKNSNSPIVVHKKTNQLTYVIKGSGDAYLNGEKNVLNEGDVIFVKNNVEHRFVATEEQFTLFHIHIPDEGRDNDRYIVSGADYDRFE